MVRIAAAGDVHASEATRERIAASFAAVEREADLVLLAGDLTTHGEPEQAQALADACRGLSIPVCAVLGNHDHHAARGDEVAAIVRAAGVTLLDGEATVVDVDETEVGVVGVKGFVGGFPGSALPDFGEPLLRRVYAETTAEVEALGAGLEAIAGCDYRIALLHYAPTATTLTGEPRGIWPFLGTDRLAEPILEHHPDVVLHGHAHAGAFRGAVGDVPVYNVAVPVLGRDFFVFELDGKAVRSAA
jgi:Icc-related predicted phosphoesterase